MCPLEQGQLVSLSCPVLVRPQSLHSGGQGQPCHWLHCPQQGHFQCTGLQEAEEELARWEDFAQGSMTPGLLLSKQSRTLMCHAPAKHIPKVLQ